MLMSLATVAVMGHTLGTRVRSILVFAIQCVWAVQGQPPRIASLASRTHIKTAMASSSATTTSLAKAALSAPATSAPAAACATMVASVLPQATASSALSTPAWISSVPVYATCFGLVRTVLCRKTSEVYATVTVWDVLVRIVLIA